MTRDHLASEEAGLRGELGKLLRVEIVLLNSRRCDVATMMCYYMYHATRLLRISQAAVCMEVVSMMLLLLRLPQIPCPSAEVPSNLARLMSSEDKLAIRRAVGSAAGVNANRHSSFRNSIRLQCKSFEMSMLRIRKAQVRGKNWGSSRFRMPIIPANRFELACMHLPCCRLPAHRA